MGMAFCEIVFIVLISSRLTVLEPLFSMHAQAAADPNAKWLTAWLKNVPHVYQLCAVVNDSCLFQTQLSVLREIPETLRLVAIANDAASHGGIADSMHCHSLATIGCLWQIAARSKPFCEAAETRVIPGLWAAVDSWDLPVCSTVPIATKPEACWNGVVLVVAESTDARRRLSPAPVLAQFLSTLDSTTSFIWDIALGAGFRTPGASRGWSVQHVEQARVVVRNMVVLRDWAAKQKRAAADGGSSSHGGSYSPKRLFAQLPRHPQSRFQQRTATFILETIRAYCHRCHEDEPHRRFSSADSWLQDLLLYAQSVLGTDALDDTVSVAAVQLLHQVVRDTHIETVSCFESFLCCGVR